MKLVQSGKGVYSVVGGHCVLR